MNAANALSDARDHAAADSAVGQIATYEDAVNVNRAIGVMNQPNATQDQVDAARATLSELGIDPDNPPTPEEAAAHEYEALNAAENRGINPLGPDDEQDGNGIGDSIRGEVNAMLGID